MAVFKRDEYEAEKKKLFFGCANGDTPTLSQLEALRRCGGELAQDDFDLAVLEIDLKTKHYTKRTSKKRAVRMLSALQAHKPKYMSNYALGGMRAITKYVAICEGREKRRNIALMLAFLLFVGGAVGLLFADRSGLLYGTGTVSFVADGKTYTQAAVQYNDYVSLQIPCKAGYDVMGVVDTCSGKMLFDENGVSKTKVEQRNLSDYSECYLEVVYEPHVYAATVCTLSGASARAFEFTVEDSPEDLLDEPQHLEGYSFDGWFTDPAYKKRFSGHFSDYIDEPLVLYPHYSLDGWTITWDLQGGEMVGIGVDNYTILTDVVLPKGDVVKRRGYDLVGWAVNGKIVEYFPATLMRDIILVAVWEPKTYKVIYQTCGGEMDCTEREFTIEGALYLQEVPTRPGYQFDGWFTSKAYHMQVNEIEAGTVGDVTLYAKWTPIIYQIEYDLDGGENSLLNPLTYTAERTIILHEPKRTGYRFDGWYDANSGEYKSDLSAIDDGDVALVATWTAKEYTITVCPDNGQSAVEQRVTYDAYFCINPPIFKGYSLDGLTFGGEQFEAVGVYEYDFDIVLMAHYQANKFQVSYISEGNMLHAQAISFGEVFRLYTPNARAGFEFVGWFDAPIGGNRVSDGVFDCDSNLVLYALWIKVLTINLESNHDYVVDKTIEKVYVVGNYTGVSDNLMTDICITISERDADLSMVLISAGFQAKENGTAIDCKNSSYTLTILLSGNSFIVGGKGSDGSDGKSGSDMTKSNCDGADGNNGGQALKCGTVIFEEADKDSSLTLKGGEGGCGGDGATQGSRNRAWCNFLPNGGRGGDSGAALSCVSFSINGATVNFEKGKEGLGGAAGYRGTIAKAKNYGSKGKDGEKKSAVIYR